MLTIPSISGLRAFEASARYLSFNQAAEELNVTPGAISRQIQSLEEFLGKSLFHRSHRKVTLTAVGRQYLSEIAPSLQKISAASQRLKSEPRRNKISICAYPTFAIRWLIPRWAALHEAFPDMDIQLTTSLNPTDFEDESFDISLQVVKEGTERKGFQIDKLLDVATYPVCSPELAKRIQKPEDLANVNLLHESPRPTDWPRWLKIAGIESIDGNKGLNFESADMALHAAIEGVGVAIGIDALIEEDVARGRLVKLFDIPRLSRFPFQVVTPLNSMSNPRLVELRNWLITEGMGKAP
ncbi:LysR substrate-binding domain-containing protein [Sneathiella limimaris]|uniref:LysR substrate-binding domain-containing protein n=1 Tax=Sneathiella limimaris TaxID=1964213 RepID=UPI00146D5197|nr:LysR substrate-binding domain-containing protein [Sneathiella limimaris]